MEILNVNKLYPRKHNGDPIVPKEYDDFKYQASVTYFCCIKNNISAIREDADGPRR